ncbi:hypothetical protein [Nocardioides sp.]|uniref:hypothetical protein n=1 Tax=Nocardioides sp. TaxID=35761 RepID=UPI0027215341|nr:hypothetical protein [Nocardioides sp.]MDO9455994.1 hypothetical protein [Nocardioides sp.]
MRPFVAAVLAILLSSLVLPTPSAEAAPARITLTPARPIAGEDAVVAGSVPGGRRPLQLQRASGVRWVVVAKAQSAASGAFRFATRGPAVATRLRVLAPAVRSRRLKAATTAVLPVRPVAQTARLAVPSAATVGTAFTATAGFAPARAGRSVQVQRLAGSSWTTVATGRQTPGGTAALRVTPSSAGATTYRAVTLAFRGAPAAASAPVTLTVSGGSGGGGGTTRVSVSTSGTQGDQQSDRPDISGDGRYVVFDSLASTLVAGDTNNAFDVFRHDRQTGTTTRITPSGADQVADQAISPTISSDGRYVAFLCDDPLVAADDNLDRDVYVWDATTGLYALASESLDGTAAGGVDGGNAEISGDGRYVVFPSQARDLVATPTQHFNVYRWDRTTGTTDLVSRAADGGATQGSSYSPSVSADGQTVAFDSGADNLVTGDANGKLDVFVWRASTGVTTLVSATASGTSGNASSLEPAISGDGSVVAFESLATDLVTGDANDRRDVFARDLTAGTTTQVSTTPGGAGATGTSTNVDVSSDGTVVSYRSTAADLVAGDTNGRDDVFLWRRATGATTRISLATDGSQGNAQSRSAALSTDGSRLAFVSVATNFAAGDTNAVNDVFARG